MIKILNSLVYLVTENPIGGINWDTVFNALGTLAGTLVGGLIAYGIAIKQFKEQVKHQNKQFIEQVEQQNKQLEKQAKKDMEREKVIIKNKIKLDTYLKMNILLTEYEQAVRDKWLNCKFYQKNTDYKEDFKDSYSKLTMEKIPYLENKLSGMCILLPEIFDKYKKVRWAKISLDEKMNKSFIPRSVETDYSKELEEIKELLDTFICLMGELSSDIIDNIHEILE